MYTISTQCYNISNATIFMNTSIDLVKFCKKWTTFFAFVYLIFSLTTVRMFLFSGTVCRFSNFPCVFPSLFRSLCFVAFCKRFFRASFVLLLAAAAKLWPEKWCSWQEHRKHDAILATTSSCCELLARSRHITHGPCAIFMGLGRQKMARFLGERDGQKCTHDLAPKELRTGPNCGEIRSLLETEVPMP